MTGIKYILQQGKYMKKFITKYKNLILITVLIIFFGFIYWNLIINQPLFGDATIHGYNAHYVLENGWQGLKADYPSFYSYLSAILQIIFGEKGLNFVVLLGIELLIIFTFLFAHVITQNSNVAALTSILVGCSPKLFFYGARMYQEVLLSAIFVICYFLLFKWIKDKNNSYLYLLCLFTGIAISLKQQGLLILLPSLMLFSFILLLKKEIALRNFILLSILPLFIALGFYGVLFHSTGQLQPGGQDFLPIKFINKIGQNIFDYNGSEISSKSNNYIKNPISIEDKLNNIDIEHYKEGNSRAETRHIWPWEPFTSFSKFSQANFLYLDFQGKPLEVIFLQYFSLIALILGIIISVKRKEHHKFLLFTLIFVLINYIMFIRNSDQQRYQFFLPLFLICFTAITLDYLLSNYNKLTLTLIWTVTILLLTPIIKDRLLINSQWSKSQLYSSSIGGIASVSEAGNWLNSQNFNGKIQQQCGNEIQYYADKPVAGDWRIYFLSKNDLSKYFAKNNVDYYVIFKSQIVDNDKWKSVCWVPRSFSELLNNNYRLAYETSYKDVFIYGINK
jgi:hypothetical protein